MLIWVLNSSVESKIEAGWLTSESLVSSDILLLIFWWLNWDNPLIVKILGLIFGPVETFELLRLDNCELTYEV